MEKPSTSSMRAARHPTVLSGIAPRFSWCVPLSLFPNTHVPPDLYQFLPCVLASVIFMFSDSSANSLPPSTWKAHHTFLLHISSMSLTSVSTHRLVLLFLLFLPMSSSVFSFCLHSSFLPVLSILPRPTAQEVLFMHRLILSNNVTFFLGAMLLCPAAYFLSRDSTILFAP